MQLLEILVLVLFRRFQGHSTLQKRAQHQDCRPDHSQAHFSAFVLPLLANRKMESERKRTPEWGLGAK